MAMRENIRNLEAVQNTALTLQQQKETERKKKQEEKEALKMLEYDVKELITNEFKKYIFAVGSDYASNFYLLERKEEILQNILKQYTYTQKKLISQTPEITVQNGITKKETKNNYEYISTIYKKHDIIEIFDKNYYKILKDITRQKLEDEKARFWQQVEEVEPLQAKKEFDYMSIFKIIGCIVFFPIVFIIAILYGAIKNQK